MIMNKVEEKVIIAGFGGQGVMLMGQILSYTATAQDLNTVWIPSYGLETRGGTANCSVTISKEMINSPVIANPDTVIAMNEPSLRKFEPKLVKDGIALVNTSLIKDYEYRKDIKVIEIDINKIALDIGNLKVANMVMLGAYLEVTKVFEEAAIHEIFTKIFTGNKAQLIELNKQALSAGIDAAKKQLG